MLLFLVFRLIFIGKQNKYTTNKIEIIQYIMTLNPDFAVEIYYKKKMLQIQAFA